MTDFMSPPRFCGIAFVESPDRPKVQLGTHKCVTRYGDEVEWISAEKRAEVNLWLLAKFGTTNDVPPGTFYYSAMFGFAIGRRDDIVKIACIT